MVLFTANKSASGQCQGGIALKKGSRDWVKNYNDLVKKYGNKTEKVSSLKPFFYDNKGAKSCISLVDLKLLNIKVQEVFKNTKSDNAVTDFKGGISSIAASNPPTTEPKTQVNKAATNPVLQNKDSNLEGAEIDSLKNIIKKLEENNEQLLNENLEKTTSKDNKSFWRNISILLTILSIIGWGLFAFLRLKIYPKKIKEKEKLHEILPSSQSEHLKTEKEEWENEKASLKEKIRELEKDKLKGKGTDGNDDGGNSQGEDKASQTGDQTVGKPKEVESPKQFYLSTPAVSPDGKGVFDGSETYSATSMSSLYHFVLINDKCADFTFLNTPSTVKDALTLPERYLQPACEYTGLNSKATKITTKKPGRATKEGNNWKITQKAEIRFE